MVLSEQVKALEEALLQFTEGPAEVTLTCKIHNDTPDGFVEISSSFRSDYSQYEKIIEAKDGMVMKRIYLDISD